jgi:HTH-type transcriptional regulator / antitoxin HigA
MKATLEKYELKYKAPSLITSETQNREYLARLSELTRQPAHSSEELRYIKLLAKLIEDFERSHYRFDDPDPVAIIRELMEANGLKQKDMLEILGGHESVVSEILSKKRSLTRNHIERLSEKFGVSPAVFFPAIG